MRFKPLRSPARLSAWDLPPAPPGPAAPTARSLTLSCCGARHRGPTSTPQGRKGGAGSDDGEAEPDAAAGEEGAQAAGAQHITLWAREVKGEGAHVKQWRVILRNLPFKVGLSVCRLVCPAPIRTRIPQT